MEPTAGGAGGIYLKRFKEVSIDLSETASTSARPSYFTNEGAKEPKWFLFRGWGLGWDNWQQMMREWRDAGDLAGLEKRGGGVTASRETVPAQ